jgi:hypothetical protein
MEACYGGTDVMERSCTVARGIDINSFFSPGLPWESSIAELIRAAVRARFKNLRSKFRYFE